MICFQTGDSTWDHPMDKHYTNLYKMLTSFKERQARKKSDLEKYGGPTSEFKFGFNECQYGGDFEYVDPNSIDVDLVDVAADYGQRVTIIHNLISSR